MLSLLTTLAQSSSDFSNYNYDYSYSTSSTVSDGTAAAVGLGLFFGVLVFALVAYLFFAFCLFKIFKKAGRQDAWAAFVPIYNQYVYYEIAGRPGWWVFLAFIPFVGGLVALVTGIIASLDLAKSFGKSSGFGVLLILLPIIGLPMLAFGDASYQGPAGPEGGKAQAPPAQPAV